jgi:hypothetical protein
MRRIGFSSVCPAPLRGTLYSFRVSSAVALAKVGSETPVSPRLLFHLLAQEIVLFAQTLVPNMPAPAPSQESPQDMFTFIEPLVTHQ